MPAQTRIIHYYVCLGAAGGKEWKVNMKFSEVYDPKGICKDITNLGRWGNGDVEVSMRDVSEIDQVMEIIEQSFNIQNDE